MPYVATLDFGFGERIPIYMNTTSSIRLDTLGVLLVSGADARNFLQGQLTTDLESLTPGSVLLGACNSPQGRVQALLWLIQRDEGIALITNSSLIERTVTRLQRYVLRSKVAISTSALQVGLLPGDSSEVLTEDRSHKQLSSASLLKLSGHRHVLVVTRPEEIAEAVAQETQLWRQDHLRAGYPQIYPQTYEQFIPQMLNLDLLGGISFEKGCYTGQEIVARTHFRGAVKRRMFRYRARCSPPLPATRILAGDQHAGDVVDAIPTEEGCELLAVMSLAQADSEIVLETNHGVRLQRVPLPYEMEVTGDE